MVEITDLTVALDPDVRRLIQAALRLDDVDALQAALDNLVARDADASSGTRLTKRGKTIAHQAAASNAVKCLAHLIAWDTERGKAGFVEVDNRGFSLIHYAAEGDAPDVIAWLVKEGHGSVHHELFQTGIPLKIALGAEKIESSVALLQHGSPRITDGTSPEALFMEDALRVPDRKLFEAYFNTQELRDAGMACATRHKLADAEAVLIELGGRQRLNLDLSPSVLGQHPIEAIEAAVQEYAERASDPGRIKSIVSHRGFEGLLRAGPPCLLQAAIRGGYVPEYIMGLACENRSQAGNEDAVFETLRAIPHEVIKRSGAVRASASACPKAIEYLVAQGFPANESFPLRGVGMAEPASQMNRIDLLLSGHPIPDGFGQFHSIKSDPWASIEKTLSLLPPDERRLEATRVLWENSVFLKADGLDVLFEAGASVDAVPAGETLTVMQRAAEALSNGTLQNRKYLRVLQHFLDRKPNLQVRDEKGKRPFALLIESYAWVKEHITHEEFPQILRAFFAQGATLQSCEDDGVSVVDALLHPQRETTLQQNAEDLEAPVPEGFSLLMNRAIEEGLDLNKRDAHGRTALMRSAAHGAAYPTEWVLSLVERGLDFDAVDKYGNTAVDHYVNRASMRRDEICRHWRDQQRAVHAHKAKQTVTTRARRAPRTGL